MPASSKKIPPRSPVRHRPTVAGELSRTGRKDGKILNSLGKWWGTKPIVLTRSVIPGSLFEASDDPDRWPEDLEIFLMLLGFDNAGTWERKNDGLKEILFRAP